MSYLNTVITDDDKSDEDLNRLRQIYDALQKMVRDRKINRNKAKE